MDLCIWQVPNTDPIRIFQIRLVVEAGEIVPAAELVERDAGSWFGEHGKEHGMHGALTS